MTGMFCQNPFSTTSIFSILNWVTLLLLESLMCMLVHLLWHSKNANSGSTFPTHTRPASLRVRRQRRCRPGSWEWKANFWRKYVYNITHYIWILLLSFTILTVASLPSISVSVIVFLKTSQSHSSGWPVSLAQTTQPDVCLLLSPLHPATPNTHICTHTHKLILSFETMNWNHWPLHTRGWHIPPPSISSSSTHCVVWDHMKEDFFFLLIFLPRLIGLGMRRSFAWSNRKRNGMWGKEWKGSCCANSLTGLGRGWGCNSFF